MPAINVHPFSTNVLDLVGRKLKTASGTPVSVSMPTTEFVIRVDGKEVCRTRDNIAASACLNNIGIEYDLFPSE